MVDPVEAHQALLVLADWVRQAKVTMVAAVVEAQLLLSLAAEAVARELRGRMVQEVRLATAGSAKSHQLLVILFITQAAVEV
jgi:hypothetical protein